MNDENNIKIYVCYHRDFHFLKSSILTPIQVGKARSDVELDMIGDDTGDNISLKNPNYCELTAQYWAWKNTKSDYVGFFHYRRFLDFSDTNQIFLMDFSNESIEKVGIVDEKISEICEHFDIIMPTKALKETTIREQYNEFHNVSDLDEAVKIVCEKYPQMAKVAQDVINSKQMNFCNLFIMKRNYYDKYMKFVFDVLFELEKRINITRYNPYQVRVFGFLAERLFNIFVAYMQQTEPELKVKELNMIVLYEPKKEKTLWQKLFSRKDNGAEIIYRVFGFKLVQNRRFKFRKP